MARALEGIVVLDLGQVYNGPYCSLLLQHLGADVVKIEPPGGEPVRRRIVHGRRTASFHFLNGGKRSLRLNLKDPRGREIFLRLAAEADVVIENFAPSAMDRLGLGYETLSAANPRLIVASARGFAANSPYRGTKAMDLTIQAMTGVLATTGFPDQQPTKAGPAICDFLGGVHLMAAVVTALYQRTTTGEGQRIEVAMRDTVIPLWPPALRAISTMTAPFRNGPGIATVGWRSTRTTSTPPLTAGSPSSARNPITGRRSADSWSDPN